MKDKEYKCPKCGGKMTKLEGNYDVWICWDSYYTTVSYHQYGSWYDPEPEEWKEDDHNI